jgi:MurNAc alpha-1-phosphate uridylyltransferase
MKAMILAAGRGERLRPLTDTTPKPMLPIRGRPLLEHQIGWLRAAGITELVINLHHLGDRIEAYLGDGSAFGVRIRYSREAVLLDTGGGIVKALPLLGSDPFVVLNGDIYTDFPFAQLGPPPAWADMHLVVTPTPAFRTEGDFLVDGGRITARGGDFVYCGIAVIRPEVFTGDEVKPFSLREHFFRAMRSGRLSAAVWNGIWTDIGTEAQLRAVDGSDSGPDSGPADP